MNKTASLFEHTIYEDNAPWCEQETIEVDFKDKNYIKDLQIGKAGEYLVCADIILQGYVAYPSEQGLRYDVVSDISGKLLRIQVKTTSTHRPVPQRIKITHSYLFQARRCGKGGRKSYEDNDTDIIAFVALDQRLIGYLPIFEVKQTMFFRTKKYQYQSNRHGKYLEDYPFEEAIKHFV